MFYLQFKSIFVFSIKSGVFFEEIQLMLHENPSMSKLYNDFFSNNLFDNFILNSKSLILLHRCLYIYSMTLLRRENGEFFASVKTKR